MYFFLRFPNSGIANTWLVHSSWLRPNTFSLQWMLTHSPSWTKEKRNENISENNFVRPSLYFSVHRSYLRLPITLGRRCRVPTSAARPMSTSWRTYIQYLLYLCKFGQQLLKVWIHYWKVFLYFTSFWCIIHDWCFTLGVVYVYMYVL